MRPARRRPLATALALALAVPALAACGESTTGGPSPQGAPGKPSGSSSSPSSSGGGTPVAAAKVMIASYKFQPAAITVKAGGKVTWTNQDSDRHTASSKDSPRVFDTGTLNKGQSKTVTFKKPGTYRYFCVYHAFMEGTVNVK